MNRSASPSRISSKAQNRTFRLLGVELILAVSLTLLGYVGYGEAFRTYPRFEIEKLAAQGEIIHTALETFLIAGLPLEQFPGFTPITTPMLNSDPTISAFYIADRKGQVVFINSRVDNLQVTETFTASKSQEKQDQFKVFESPTYYRVTYELKNKFESVGTLNVLLPRSVIEQRINTSFYFVLAVALVLMIIFGGLIVWLDQQTQGRTTSWVRISYTIVFFIMAMVVVGVLVSIYSTGIQAKTKALADSLSTRLNAPLNLGLAIDSFDGLDSVFKDYRNLNPDLSYIALTVGDKALIHTDPRRVGEAWQSYPNHYEYTAQLRDNAASSEVRLGVHVGIPQSIIYEKLWRSVKNFFVLFIASAFLSLLLFDLVQTLTGKPMTSPDLAQAQRDYNLSLIQPYYFFSVFAEGMSTAFLSPYMQQLAKDAGVDKGLASTVFTVYFLAFVIALIPAGQFAEKRGVKPLLILGSVLTAIGLISVAFVNNFYWMFLIRAIAGAGQGILLVGVQSYILQMASATQRTQAAAIIVFGYNGGMISGSTIGALLVVYMGVQNVFVLSGMLTVLIFIYTLRFMPNIIPGQELIGARKSQTATPPPQASGNFWSNVGKALRDLQFLKAMLFIGIPSKAILTGVTIFAMPLVLSRLQYAQEDIGQIVMLYSGGVLISSAYASRMVDRIGRTSGVLLIGALASGLGLVLIGLLGWGPLAEDSWAAVSVAVLMFGMAVLGLAHGLINAPIITHIASTHTASTMGQSPAASLYRLLERIGHISGPTVAGYLLILSQDNAVAISWVGVAMIVFGLLFALPFGNSPSTPKPNTGD